MKNPEEIAVIIPPIPEDAIIIEIPEGDARHVEFSLPPLPELDSVSQRCVEVLSKDSPDL